MLGFEKHSALLSRSPANSQHSVLARFQQYRMQAADPVARLEANHFLVEGRLVTAQGHHQTEVRWTGHRIRSRELALHSG